MDLKAMLQNEFAGRPRRVAACLSLVVVILVGGGLALATWRSIGRPPAQPEVYFINEETGDLVLQSLTAVPPLPDAHGNPTLVRAVLYSLDGGKTKTAAYYEKYSDKAKQMLQAAATDPDSYDTRVMEKGRLVRLPEKGAPWIPAESAEGRKILARLPEGDNVTYCSVVAR